MSSKDFDKFIDCIEDGKLDLVKLHCCSEFLDKIIISSENNSRPIHIASRIGNVAIVEYLLKEGSDVEAETSNGKRALHFAAMEGHDAVLRLLIEHCSDIEAETCNGERPIHYASMKGHSNVLKILIDNNCRLEPRDRDGNTPLTLAATCENEECMQLLATAIENRKTKQVIKPLKIENEIPLKELIKHNYVSTVIDPENGKTLLDMVLERNEQALLDIIKLKPVEQEELDDFLNMKKNALSPQSYKMLEECILYRSIRHGNGNGYYYLARPEVVNRASLFMGQTVLEMSVEYNWNECLKTVLKHLMKSDESWERAMEMAKKRDYQKIYEYIISRQGYLFRRDRVGYSRLHIAMFDDAPHMVRYILDNNLLPINIGDKERGTPLALAYAMLYVNCIKAIEEYNPSADTTDRYHQTPLHIAIASGWDNCCDYLLEQMTDLEAKDCYGFTVLDRARKKGYQDIADRLIAKGAIYHDDPRLTDGEPYALPMF